MPYKIAIQMNCENIFGINQLMLYNKLDFPDSVLIVLNSRTFFLEKITKLFKNFNCELR